MKGELVFILAAGALIVAVHYLPAPWGVMLFLIACTGYVLAS